MKLVLVWELLSLAFIVRYCAASDPNPNRTPDSDTTSISISLPEEISKGNPISAITDAANFQQEKPSPDYPFDIVESFGLHSQSKSDPCLSDKNPATSRRRRLRRQYCSSQFISPDSARKNPVTLPPMRKTWSNDLNIPAAKQVPWSGGIIEDRNVCSDEWHNMPACAPESSAIGDYLPSCRPRTYSCKDGDILFCCGFVALNPWETVGPGIIPELLSLKYRYYGIQCLRMGGMI